MTTALNAAGNRNLLVRGAVAGQCLREGLIVEILIHVLPVLLGAGVRLCGDSGPPRSSRRSMSQRQVRW